MSKNPILIKNATLINEGKNFVADVLVQDDIISKIGNLPLVSNYKIIDGTGKHLFPGIIDAQVHFREPGLTHKGDISTESKAAVALAELKGLAKTLPNQSILINGIVLKEAKASSEIENVITTHDKLYQALILKDNNVDGATKEVLRYNWALTQL